MSGGAVLDLLSLYAITGAPTSAQCLFSTDVLESRRFTLVALQASSVDRCSLAPSGYSLKDVDLLLLLIAYLVSYTIP